MPPTLTIPEPIDASIAASFGNGSVVMIARAAAGPPDRGQLAAGIEMPASTSRHVQLDADDAGGRHEHFRSQNTRLRAPRDPPSRARAPGRRFRCKRSRSRCSRRRRVRGRRTWRRCSCETSTGAACARLVVNTAAAEASPSETISARSGAPDFLMPQATPAARNPCGAPTDPWMLPMFTASTPASTALTPGSAPFHARVTLRVEELAGA